MDLTLCPECASIAEVLWRDRVESTDGPVEHIRIQCLQRHCFLLPTSKLDRRAARASEAVEARQHSPRIAPLITAQSQIGGVRVRSG